MSSFEEYEEEAKDCIAKATKATSEANAASFINEAKDLIQQMKFEMRSLFGAEKTAAANTVKTLEQEVSEAEKASLFGGSGSGGGGGAVSRGMEATERARLDESTAKLERSSARLERSRMLVAEMEDIGTDIVGTLAENREKIASTHEKVKTANSELDKAQKISKRMGRFGANW